MSGAIEEAAKKWLTDPAYQKVFKHTFDVVEDYVCYGLIAVGAIALSVRFLTTLGSGEVTCILKGVDHVNSSDEDLGPYPGGGTNTIVQYANHNQGCVDQVITTFMQYLPFILLVEGLILILIEKFTLKIPKVSGKIERFYTNIVEESLFGKDPDVAEDVCEATSAEAISRIRRRNEVCMSLKRSSIIHNWYIFKNLIELLLLFAFIPVNLYFGFLSEETFIDKTCTLNIGEIPELQLGQGKIYFQCEGKKVRFLLNLLWVQLALLFLHAICSVGSVVWCLFLRGISKLLKKMKSMKDDEDWDHPIICEDDGKDFLFLFDLLAHTSGIESTLRVLSHSDDTIRQLCKPILRGDYVDVHEDKLRVFWYAASIEKWLLWGSHRDIVVDSYDVTIFPGETMNNSVSKKVKLKKNPDDEKYSHCFVDLQGGKTEYVISIACVIGKSRMKGERIVTTLMPYGPEKPRGGMVKNVGMNEVEIRWEPPKGEFLKYILTVDENTKSTSIPYVPNFLPHTYSSNEVASMGDLNEMLKGLKERDLSNQLTEYTILGLQPGEIYNIELRTKSGGVFGRGILTREPISETVLTKPEPVKSLSVECIETDTSILKWVAPDGHTKLKAFNIIMSSLDKTHTREITVTHDPNELVKTFELDELHSATQYSVDVTTLCVYSVPHNSNTDGINAYSAYSRSTLLKTTSEPESKQFITLPEPPRHLELDSRYCNSFTVKWEAPIIKHNNAKFKLKIEASNIGYTNSYEVTGDRLTFNFSKLPDIIGTGEKYHVEVCYSVVPVGCDEKIRVDSHAVVGTFTTKPISPTNFKILEGTNYITWTKSTTPSVNMYKIKIKSIEEGSKSEKFLIPSPADDSATCSYEMHGMQPMVQHKVNIYAMVDDDNGESNMSQELHEKIILLFNVNNIEYLAIYTEEKAQSIAASDTGGLNNFSRQTSVIGTLNP